jgi:hyperosmotically inducible protein
MHKPTSYSAVLVLVLALMGPMLVSACGGGKAISNTTDDATITARVKTVLVNDPDVAGRTIDVSTAAGVVTLSGTVKTPADRDKAVGLARKVGGVKDVKSALQVQQ